MLREGGALPRTPRGPSAPPPRLRTQAINCPLKRGSSNLVTAILGDRNGNVWIGGGYGDLTRFRDGHFTTYGRPWPPNDGLVPIIESQEGDLWFGSSSGITRFRLGEFRTYTTQAGLPSNQVISIYEDSDNTLWIGTFGGGLSRFRNEKFTNFTMREGLPDNVIFGVLEDHHGRFWMSSHRGIFCVAKRDLDALASGKARSVSVTTYRRADGMKSSECEGATQPPGWKTRDGKLWFPTTKGVVVVDPDHVKPSDVAPPVHIEQILNDQRAIKLDAGTALPPGRGEIEFHYTALSFSAPERVRFRYRLNGFDRHWIDAGTRRVAYYTNLPPGSYTFRVVACNGDGIWNNAGASMAFVLQPHFYRTAWFYFVCGLALCLLVWCLYQLRVRAMQARFSAVLAERNRLAREIHDTVAQSLAGVALQLEAVAKAFSKGPQAARDRLDQARTLVRNALTEARGLVSGLRPAVLDCGDLATAFKLIARQVSGEIPVEVSVHGTPRRLSGVVENNLLRIGQEALANASTHAHATRIGARLRFDERCIELLVWDDGCGFHPDGREQINSNHFGLAGMRERAAMLGARISLESEPGKGTKVLVTVPLQGTPPELPGQRFQSS